MKIIIPVIVGAVIGYFTNWLAIKMLFKPHYEKRIFGIKIPFTPGLIPKEKERISKNIGDTVGEHLLSTDTILESLSNKETDNKIRTLAFGEITKLKENQLSIGVYLHDNLGKNFGGFLAIIRENLNGLIISTIRKEKFRSKISDFLKSKIKDIEFETIYNSLEAYLTHNLVEIIDSENLKDKIIEKLVTTLKDLEDDERKLGELLPQELLDIIYEYINKNGEDIGNAVRASFKDTHVQKKLKSSISNLVDENVNKMITMFLSPDAIADKIYNIIEKYLDNVNTNKDIIMIINLLLDKALELEISNLGRSIYETIEVDRFDILYDLFRENLKNEDSSKFIIDTIMEEIKSSETQNKDIIVSFLNKKIGDIIDDMNISHKLDIVLREIEVIILEKPMGEVLEDMDEDNFNLIYDLIRDIFDKLSIDYLPMLIEMFNISNIVEEKINSFDVDFTEKLILDIANKELKAITWLGALLGGIMGLLTPLLQMLN